MHYFIDCEFNEFGGELISLALVPYDPRDMEFYAELPVLKEYGSWVKDHVVPLLDKKPETLEKIQSNLRQYFQPVMYPSIIADHPVDIAHFCRVIDLNKGDYIGTTRGYQFTVMPGLGSVKSVRPHHALYDARAIRDSFRKR